jgi:hypothetical protein
MLHIAARLHGLPARPGQSGPWAQQEAAYAIPAPAASIEGLVMTRHRRRWAAAIEGRETGIVQPLTFVKFWRQSSALRWVNRMNSTKSDQLTRYVVVEL